MGKRVCVGIAPNEDMGQMYALMFREAGIPILVMRGRQAVGQCNNPMFPTEMWIEDSDLLEDPDVKGLIEQVLGPIKVGPPEA